MGCGRVDDFNIRKSIGVFSFWFSPIMSNTSAIAVMWVFSVRLEILFGLGTLILMYVTKTSYIHPFSKIFT